MAKKSDDIKENIKFAASIVLLALGVIIVFVSLFLPPTGVIDASVLTLIGENFCFVGAVWGIGQYANVQIAKIERFGERQTKREEECER